MKKASEKFERNYTIEDLEQLLDSIPYELYLKDFDGRYKYANKSSMDRAGVNRDGIIGKMDSEFRTEEMAKICIDGDKRVLERGKETFIEDKIIYDNFETSYEVFKTIVHNNETRESMIGGISKFLVKDKSISKYITNTSDSITNNTIDLNSQSVIKEVLLKLREIIQAKDISLYLYDYKAQEMIFVENFGYNPKVVMKQKYMVDNNYYENTSGIIHEVLSNNMFKDIYLLKNNNKLLGCIEIYYTMKPNSINEEFISYVCMVLSYIQSNKIFTDNLKEEIKNRKEAYDKLEMVIEKSIDFYALVKKTEDNFVWIETNKKFKEIIGWSVEELNSKNLIEFIHPDDKERVQSNLFKVLKNHYMISYSFICKDGQYRTARCSFNYLNDNIYVLSANDTTQLTKLKKENKELEYIVEFETLKTEFFANLSHEFKTPLNIILSTVQFITNYIDVHKKHPDNDSYRKYLKSIKQNSYRLLKLANNMIDITKIDGGFYEINIINCNIIEVIEDIVQSLAEYIQDNKRNIIFDTSEEEVIIACDPNQIERIVLNILSNAMKFTSNGGNIYVDIDISDDCSKVIIRIGNDGEKLKQEDSVVIFDRFTQTEDFMTRKSEGSGIGLSLVKSLVEMHKGSIYVNTEISKGTEFCIELPIRKIMNNKTNYSMKKSLNSKVEKFDIEFSDIYS